MTTIELPLWFTKKPEHDWQAPGLGCKLVEEIHHNDGDPSNNDVANLSTVAVIYTPVGSVKWRSDCQYCTQHCMGRTDFFPTHEAGRNCESGKYSHCTCDSCF